MRMLWFVYIVICTCYCLLIHIPLDGVMKGPYEKGGYKFFYYNVEKETWVIFMIAVISIITFERSFVRILELWFSRNLDYFTAFVMLCSLPANYFGIWVCNLCFSIATLTVDNSQW